MEKGQIIFDIYYPIDAILEAIWALTEYSPSACCREPETHKGICLKCGLCGREFSETGIMANEGVGHYK